MCDRREGKRGKVTAEPGEREMGMDDVVSGDEELF